MTLKKDKNKKHPIFRWCVNKIAGSEGVHTIPKSKDKLSQHFIPLAKHG
jgi:hypothetical protein